MNYNLPTKHFHILADDIVINENFTLPKHTICVISEIIFHTTYNKPRTSSVYMRTLKKWNGHHKKTHEKDWKYKRQYIRAVGTYGSPHFKRGYTIQNKFSMGWTWTIEQFNNLSQDLIPLDTEIIDKLIEEKSPKAIDIVFRYVKQTYGIDLNSDWEWEKEKIMKMDYEANLYGGF